MVRVPIVIAARLGVLGIQLVSSLDADTAATTERGDGIGTSGTLNIVLLPCLAPENHDGYTGHYTAEQTAQDARLAQAVSVALDLATGKKGSTAAVSTVSAAVAHAIIPLLLAHFVQVSWLLVSCRSEPKGVE
jgi:hypothetical protein